MLMLYAFSFVGDSAEDDWLWGNANLCTYFD